jgi:hypothetical protein
MELLLIPIVSALLIILLCGALVISVLGALCVVHWALTRGADVDGRLYEPATHFWRLGRWIRDYYRHRIITDGTPATPEAWLQSKMASGSKHRPRLYLAEPHGMLVLSAVGAFLHCDRDPTLSRERQLLRVRQTPRLVVHPLLLRIPPIGWLLLRLGCVGRTPEAIDAALARGDSLVVIPEGTGGMGTPFLPPRRGPPGILRVAFDRGLPVVPVFFGGEAETCWTWASEPRVWTWLRRAMYQLTGYPLFTFFYPRLGAGRPRLTTYVGAEIDPRSPSPRPGTYETADAFHEFVAAYFPGMKALRAQHASETHGE